MIKKVLDFVKSNYMLIAKVLLGLFLFYWIIFVLTPKAGMSAEQKQQLDSLNAQIKILHQDNVKLEAEIDEYNNKIEEVDHSIDKIKGQKKIGRAHV